MSPEARPKILAIDASEVDAKALESDLTALGADVSIARNAPDGLYAAVSQSPDVILLELLLPGSSGIQVLTELKRQPSTTDIPAVIISDVLSEQAIRDSIRAGARDYLLKPWDSRKLEMCVSWALKSTGKPPLAPPADDYGTGLNG